MPDPQTASQPTASQTESRTAPLPVLALTTGVVLPGMVVTIALETDEAKAAAEAALEERRILLVPRVGARFASVGTVGTIEDVGDLPSGVRALVVRGTARARLGAGVPGTGRALWVHAEVVESPPPSARAVELARDYRGTVEAILELRGASRLAEALRGIDDPGQMADVAGYSPDLDFEHKVEVLETVDVEARLEKVLGWATDVLAELTVKDKIRQDVHDGMERQQREFLLRQQLAAIRKELGDDDESAFDGYRARIAELDLPEAVLAALDKELAKLERTGAQNPEQGWIRSWIDAVLEVPWGRRSDDAHDLRAARAVLDADHAGLDDVKERVIELLAVRKLRAERGVDAEAMGGRGSGAILALVGPPGVGKTSLGESVARALGRSFSRVALGGVRDEAEIRGHRRTYVGAQPGRIVRALREAGTMNPVLLLDEVDKLSPGGWSGDPTAALLEVLDPAQNHTFRDHYLEVELDLSDVLFLATANVLETIPAPLLDRMEIVNLDGYTEDEKLVIANQHLLPRQRERVGLRSGEVELTDAALRTVVTDYTREAGVRNLERQLGTVLRKVATQLAGGEAAARVTVDRDDIARYLGRPKFFAEEIVDRTTLPGVATGLAVTGTGGDVLFVEASAMEGEPGLTVTGQLGDVMRESSEIALSYVRAHARELGLPTEGLHGRRFHVHVPAGAVPKDGPSAGVTMTTALVSLVSGRPVRGDVGMTGEVTLQGRVLPVGGVKQKVLAAHRAGLRTVVLPARNAADLDDVPEPVRSDLTIELVSDVREALAAALG